MNPLLIEHLDFLTVVGRRSHPPLELPTRLRELRCRCAFERGISIHMLLHSSTPWRLRTARPMRDGQECNARQWDIVACG